MPAAAFFDLDKTILARSSALAFAGPLYRARLITRRDVTRSAYAQFSLATGRVDHAAMERMRARLSILVAGWDTQVLQQLIDDQLGKIVPPLIFAEATALIRHHQEAGDHVVIVTSTGTEMAEPIGALLGIHDVLATRMTELEGRYTGDIEDYMYGPRKAEAMAHGPKPLAARSSTAPPIPIHSPTCRCWPQSATRTRSTPTGRCDGWPLNAVGRSTTSMRHPSGTADGPPRLRSRSPPRRARACSDWSCTDSSVDGNGYLSKSDKPLSATLITTR